MLPERCDGADPDILHRAKQPVRSDNVLIVIFERLSDGVLDGFTPAKCITVVKLYATTFLSASWLRMSPWTTARDLPAICWTRSSATGLLLEKLSKTTGLPGR